ADLFSPEMEEPVQTEEGASLQEMAACHPAPPHESDARSPSTEELPPVVSQASSDAPECDSLPQQLHPALDEAIQKDLSISNRERHDWIERWGSQFVRWCMERITAWQISGSVQQTPMQR
ncbi:MAG: hypothetical protein ACJ788_10045, partial [Ktedonobacteraceae bacterium]